MNDEEQQQNIPPEEPIDVVPVFGLGAVGHEMPPDYYDIVQRYYNMNAIHHMGDQELRAYIIELRGARQTYFDHWFVNRPNLHIYIATRAVISDHYFNQLYLLLIYTRVMDEAIYVLSESNVIADDGWDELYRRDHIVEDGIRLCHRLYLILAVIDGTEYEDFDIMINFVQQMTQHFEERRLFYNYRDEVPNVNIIETPYPLIFQDAMQNIPPPEPGIHDLHPEAPIGSNIVDAYHYMNEFHRLSAEDLRQSLIEFINGRQTYFAECFQHLQPEYTFRYFISTGAITLHYRFYMLYFLLIFTRVIEQAIHSLSKKQIPTEHIYRRAHIVEEGIQLCLRLNILFINNPNFRPEGYNLLTTFVRRTGQHFINMAQKYNVRLNQSDILQNQILEMDYFPIHLNLSGVRPNYPVLRHSHAYIHLTHCSYQFLRNYIDNITNQRDLYFTRMFAILNKSFDLYIVTRDQRHGELSDEDYFLVLYFLLIFCRLIDWAMVLMREHVIAEGFPDYEDREQTIISQGRRLCELLRNIIYTWSPELVQDRQVMYFYVRDMGNHFLQRQQLYDQMMLQPPVPDHDINIAPNDPVINVHEEEANVPIQQVLPPQFQFANIPNIGQVMPLPLPEQQWFPPNVNFNVNYLRPGYGIVHEYNIRVNLNTRKDLTRYMENLIRQRDIYFLRFFPHIDFNVYFIGQQNENLADIQLPFVLYYLLFFTRVIVQVLEEAANRGRIRNPNEAHILRTNNVRAGLRLCNLLNEIFDTWDEGLRQDRQMMIGLLDNMLNYFIQRRDQWHLQV